MKIKHGQLVSVSRCGLGFFFDTQSLNSVACPTKNKLNKILVRQLKLFV